MYKRQLQANLLARSGINLGEAILGFDQDVQVDAFSEEWCPEPAEESCRIDGSTFGLPDNMLLRIEIFDESGKININLTKPRNINEYTSKLEDPTRFLLYDKWRMVFERVLQNEGLDPDAALRLYEHWDTQIDAALNSGATDADGDVDAELDGDVDEDEQAAGEELDERPAGAAVFSTLDFATLDDANAVLGLSAAELRSVRRWVTAAVGVTRVNANTAPREVLTAIVGDEGLVEDIINRRLDTPMQTTEVTSMVPPVSVGEGIPDPRRMLQARSDIFRIVASGVVNPNPFTGRGGIGRSASLLVRRRQSRVSNVGQDAAIAWTFTRLDWQKEGGALLFDESRDEQQGSSGFARDRSAF